MVQELSVGGECADQEGDREERPDFLGAIDEG